MGDVMQAVGLAADPNAGKAQMQMSQAEMDKALAAIEDLDIPPIEKQELQLNLMSEAGFITPEQLGETAMEDVSLDPRLREAQMAALSELQERGEVGLTPEERQQFRDMQQDVAGQTQAQQSRVLQQMAERGTLDSGAQLAAQLQAGQMANQQASDVAAQLAGQSASARRDALQRAASSASGMRSQDFSEQSRLANARDTIEQFNLGQRSQAQQQNLGIRQSDIGTQNRQQQYNKELIGQQYGRELEKQGMLSNLRQGRAQEYQRQAQAAQAAEQAKAAGNRALLGKAAGAIAGGPIGAKIGGAMFSSDPIQDASTKDMRSWQGAYEKSIKPGRPT